MAKEYFQVSFIFFEKQAFKSHILLFFFLEDRNWDQ